MKKLVSCWEKCADRRGDNVDRYLYEYQDWSCKTLSVLFSQTIPVLKQKKWAAELFGVFKVVTHVHGEAVIKIFNVLPILFYLKFEFKNVFGVNVVAKTSMALL